MNDNYDCIVLGTGLKECMIAGLLAKNGKMGVPTEKEEQHTKILQLDRNNYYGSESASLNLTNLWKMFRAGQEPNKNYGENRDWNVDLIPKFVMAGGNLVSLLLKTNVSQYLEWKCVDGTFVYQWTKPLLGKEYGEIHKVPATAKEAATSGLMSLFEKGRCKSFLGYVNDYDEKDPKTYNKYDLKTMTMKELFDKYSLEPNTRDFIGHAVALYTNDDFMDEPAIKSVNRMQDYVNSYGKYGPSPFIYPVWGLSGIAEGFSRLCALYGGTYMLNRDVEEILLDENKKFKGIKSNGEVAYGQYLIAEPTYIKKIFPEKVKSIGKVYRCILILDHPVKKTENCAGCQIILPQRQVNRKNDIFIACLNSSHCVCKKGYNIAIISTLAETQTPFNEIKPALELIGPYLEKFETCFDQLVPVDPTFPDNIFITSSFDPLSHFEQDTNNVIELYEKMTNTKLDLTPKEDETKEG